VNLREYRVFFLIVTAVLALLAASPALSRLLILPQTDFFTEFWMLGPNHKAEEYPFNISRNHNYSVFLGIGNHLGYCGYYFIEVKFRNQTQPAANSFNRTPSSLPSLFNITAFVANDEVWELPLTFSFDYARNETLQQVKLRSIILNDVSWDMKNYTITKNSQNNDFLGNLFFELWFNNQTTGVSQYHERFVNLWLNLTG